MARTDSNDPDGDTGLGVQLADQLASMPATGARSGTPALSMLSVEAHTEPMEVEPLELSTSETTRIA